ncbi:hypothetical protein ACM66B_003394 [Microbotryomycetes sp. NB124-2]
MATTCYYSSSLDPSEQVSFTKQCYTITLGPPGSHMDLKSRQRTEFLSWPACQLGDQVVYKWKYHLSRDSNNESTKFLHLMQLLSREKGGWIVALSLANGKVKLVSTLNEVVDEGQKSVGGTTLTTRDEHQQKDELPSIDVKQFAGQTTFHRCVVKYGPGGSVDYSVSTVPDDTGTYETLLHYKIEDVYVPSLTSVKTGLYRAHNTGPLSACVGDFEFFKR